MHRVFWEALDRRNYYTAAAGPSGFDPAYAFSYANLTRLTGAATQVFQALPAPGNRTYLLAVRDEKAAKHDINQGGLLTIVALNADGTLDTSFGTGGAAMTGRVLNFFNDPGILRLDTTGRLYFGDSTRVLRFTADGRTDRSFAQNGVAYFGRATDTPVLCDLAPTGDGGVLIATEHNVDGVEHFVVQKAGRNVRTVWQTEHDADGPNFVLSLDPEVSPATAQFAVSGGHIVLARLQSDDDTFINDHTSLTDYEPNRQDVIVTRFDDAGHGTDVASAQARLPAQGETTAIGPNGYQTPDTGALLLSRNGRFLSVQTTVESLHFDLKAGAFHRATLPDSVDAAVGSLNYQQLADGGFATFEDGFVHKDSTRPSVTIKRYLPDGTLDLAFGDAGVLVVGGKHADISDDEVEQVFLDSSGRLYLLTNDRAVNAAASVTLRRA